MADVVVKEFKNSKVTYKKDDSYRPVEIWVNDEWDGEQATVCLGLEELVRLKYFLEECIKDYCDG